MVWNLTAKLLRVGVTALIPIIGRGIPHQIRGDPSTRATERDRWHLLPLRAAAACQWGMLVRGGCYSIRRGELRRR